MIDEEEMRRSVESALHEAGIDPLVEIVRAMLDVLDKRLPGFREEVRGEIADLLAEVARGSEPRDAKSAETLRQLLDSQMLTG